MGMKLVIVGGVAAGATAAARARRISEDAEITLIERGPYVSFANCGLPYYVSGAIAKRSKLLLQTPEGFDARYRVKVLVNAEAVGIDRERHLVRLADRSQGGGEARSLPAIEYDKLILAQGGLPTLPPVPGADSPNVFTVWSLPDADRIASYIEKEGPRTALVAGGGFIGLEMAEAFRERGLDVTVVELLPRLMGAMDGEFGAMIEAKLREKGVRVVAGTGLDLVDYPAREARLSDGSRAGADIVLFSVGVRPELALAKAAGLGIGASGGLLVDDELRTSDHDIYAAGDMIEVTQAVSGRKVRVPLAGPANRQGRVAASNALGMRMKYHGAYGTSVVKVFDSVAASTGLTEKAARDAGLDAGAAIVVKDHHASYYPGSKELTLKLVYDRKSSRVLGAQAFGAEGVEKRIDVVATALRGKLTLQDLSELDLAYAPPFSSANDPVNVAAFVGLNDVSGLAPTETPAALKADIAAAGAAGRPITILDVRNRAEYEAGHLAGALNVPLDELRFSLDAVPRGGRIHALCRSGYRSYLAQRILKQSGFDDVVNVTGGFAAIQAEGGFETADGE